MEKRKGGRRVGRKERSQTDWIEFSNMDSHYTSFHKIGIVSDEYLHIHACIL